MPMTFVPCPYVELHPYPYLQSGLDNLTTSNIRITGRQAARCLLYVFGVAQDYRLPAATSNCIGHVVHMAYFSYEHGANSARRFRYGGLQMFALHTFFTYPRYDDIREEGIAARLNCSHNKLRVTVAGRSCEHTSAGRALPL